MRRLPVLIAALTLLFAVSVCAEETPYVFAESFETPSVFDSWDGGIQDSGLATDGSSACVVNNPYGEEIDGRVSHVLSYFGSVPLKTAQIYKISFDVMSLSSDATGAVISGVRFGDGADNIVFEFGNIPERWVQVSEFFMVPRDADYHFSIELKEGYSDLGFFVDNLVIQKIDLSPQSLTIIGSDELTIPAAGEESSRYSVGAYTVDGEVINLLTGISSFTAEDLPAGVSFNSDNNTVTVSEGCPDGASFLLVCTPPDYIALDSAILEVTLTKNVLKNSDFSTDTDMWEIDTDFDLGSGTIGNYVSMNTANPCAYGYSASISPINPVVLIENVMYVFRAKVRVESGADTSVYSQNTALSLDGRVDIEILDLSAGDWTEVIAAFTPEASGVYELNISFITSEPGVVCVGAMALSPELSDETYITLHAPGNICVPDTVTSYPMNAYIRDQAGVILSSRCNLRLYPEGKGVELVNGYITVSPDAIAGEYEIYASSRTNSSIESSLIFTVSHNNIGDGGFEEKPENEWWAAASPALLTIEEYADGRYARIVSEDSFAVVLNNSYMHLYAELPYAFRASVVDGKPSVITAFIETIDGDRIPIVQSETSDGQIFELFQTDYDLVGRLMLHITSEDGGNVELGIDNVELFRSILTVTAPNVSGLAESGATLRVDFSFFNNMDPANDSSACAISWYSIDSNGSNVTHVGSGEEFVVLPNLVGRYVYAEVTPICAITGLSGLPVQSVPVSIGTLHIFDNSSEPENTQTSNEEPALTPVKLSEDMSSPFTDMEHWSAEYVLPLYNSGIVKGKTDSAFCPDDGVTRAEFSALICRAFGAKGGSHSFSDVSEDAWYSENVAALTTLGIINGTSETEFSPDALLTREQMLSILVRIYEALGNEAGTDGLSRFYDRSDISSWAEIYVSKGLDIGLVNGTEQSTFLPKRSATRAEACTMLYRLLKILEEK